MTVQRVWAAVGGGVLTLGLAVVPAAAHARSAGPAASAAPFVASSVAWTGQDTVVAGTDSHGDLYYYAQPPGSAGWAKQLVAAGGSTQSYSSPAIGWTGTAVVIAAVDSSGDLVVFSAKAGEPGWTESTLATSSAGAYQDPALTVAGTGEVLISASTSTGSLEAFTLAPGSTSWQQKLVAAGPFTTSSITTLENSSGQYFRFITASDGGTLYFWWGGLGSSAWEKEVVATTGSVSYTGGSVTATSANTWITASTSAGAVVSFVQPLGGSTWTENPVSVSGKYRNPQITWTGPAGDGAGYDVITATTAQGGLSYWYNQEGVPTSWVHETVAGAGAKADYADPAIVATSTSVDIAAVNTALGDIDNWTQAFTTNPWHKQTVAAGPPAPKNVDFQASSVAWTGQNTVIAGVDGAGDLYCFAESPGSSKWVTELVALGGQTPDGYYSEPSAGWTGRSIVIAAIDDAGNLDYFSSGTQGAAWTEQTVGNGAGSIQFSDPSLTVAANGDVLITAGTSNGYLESFTLAPGGTWVESLVAQGPFQESSVTTGQGMAYVTAADGSPATLYLWSESLSSQIWHKEIVASGDADDSYAEPSVAVTGANVVIAVQDAPDLTSFTRPVTGTTWSRFYVSNFLPQTPEITWTGPVDGNPGYDVITAIGNSGNVDYWWAPDGTTLAWNPETVATYQSGDDYFLPGITATGTTVDIDAIDVNSIDNWYQPFGATGWTEQVVAKGLPSPRSPGRGPG